MFDGMKPAPKRRVKVTYYRRLRPENINTINGHDKPFQVSKIGVSFYHSVQAMMYPSDVPSARLPAVLFHQRSYQFTLSNLEHITRNITLLKYISLLIQNLFYCQPQYLRLVNRKFCGIRNPPICRGECGHGKSAGTYSVQLRYQPVARAWIR